MSQIIKELGLLPGDRIVVPKSWLNFIQHHAIYLGQNKQGQHFIAENKVGVGVRLTNVEDFFSGVKSVTRIERFTGNNYQRKLAVQKALSKLHLPYDLINYNCQHFANEVQYGEVESDQVSKAIAFGLTAVLVGFLMAE